jgi:pyruvoyl-dependent arginine decarboxylase (PvlArgDC)
MSAEKRKAISLVDEFYEYTNTTTRENAKSCAKILANEMLSKIKSEATPTITIEFWEGVLEEIDRIESWGNIERPRP